MTEPRTLSFSFKSQSWIAVVLGVLVVALSGFMKFRTRSIDPAKVEGLEMRLRGEYTGKEVGKVQDKLDQGNDRASIADAIEEMRRKTDVEISSVTRRGMGNSTVIRVDYRIGGEPPSDGRSPRYYRAEWSLLRSRWIIRAPTTSFAYGSWF